MDIREIRLLKNFSTVRSAKSGNNDTKQSGFWHVFGHYDYMEITQIAPDPNEHPLETILAHSDEWTLKNAGNTKQHLMYGIANNEDMAADFWKKSAELPLLMISLIHFKHPLKDFEKRVSNLENTINCTIKQTKSTCYNDLEKYKLFYSSYISIDTSDLIIFWATNSIQATMAVIASVWKQHTDEIYEFFTLLGCHQRSFITEENCGNELYKSWLGVEPILACVRTHIRGKNFRQILSHAQAIVDLVRKHPDRLQDKEKETTADYCIIPGQDDIVLYFENLPLKLFVEMYQRPTGSVTTPSLTGRLGVGTDIISRSVVDTFFAASLDEFDQGMKIFDVENKQNSDNNNSHLSNKSDGNCPPNPYEKLKQAVDEANKDSNVFPTTHWLSALYELLVELAYLKTSPTSHDMYMQSKDCHEILVNHIVEIIQKREDNEDRYLALTDPTSALVTNIQQYIQGWSQLSFHSMLAELQLTQTSDINRMYLYPSKLNRIYTSFMQYSSAILSEYDQEDNPKNRAYFFLTPSMRSNEAFWPIFDQFRDSFENDTLVILGELPADLLFSPQVLLPILVHEAAHYAGFRKRKLRYKYLAKSMLAHLVDEYVQEDVLYQKSDDEEIYPFQEVVDELYERKLKDLMENQPCYGNTVHDKLLDRLQAELQGYRMVSEIFGILFSRDEYIQWSQTKKLIFKEKHIGNLDSGVRSLSTIESINNLEVHYDRLISIYREAHADMCMIKLLGLSPLEYLGIVYRSSRFKDRPGNRLQSAIQDAVRDLSRSERYLCVIAIAYVNDGLSGEEFDNAIIEILDDCIEQTSPDVLDDVKNVVSGSVSKNDYLGIRFLAQGLKAVFTSESLNHEQDGIEYSTHVFYYDRAWIMDYLREVKAGLPDSIFDLRKVYTALASEIRNVKSSGEKSFLAFLESCIDLARNDPKV